MSDRYRSRSFWLDTLPHPLVPRPALSGDTTADVAIVGGGYTGLWTAYYLLSMDPSLRVLVIERDITGFGASGRNGGWCVGELAAGPARHERVAGNEGARRMLHALFDAVDEVGRVARREDIDCQYAKGGTIRLARNRAQLTRQRAEVEHHQQAYGLTDDDLRLLDADEAGGHLSATEVMGGLFFAHTAALQPARLVRGLAEAVERRGGTIVEGTTATAMGPGLVVTDCGRVRAEVTVRALEGYTGSLEGHRRSLAPLYSLMVATEPLDDATWDTIGLHQRQTFADDRYLVIYGQRTADGRIAFGGRGAPYNFGSRILPSVEQRSRTHDRVARTLVELLPVLKDTAITHRWGGVIGVPRDWFPSVGYDRPSGLAWAGGYVGEGVAAANLAGRTLAELITDTDSPRTDLHWVGHRSRRWAPEPLRWLGINAALAAMDVADRSEARTGKPSRLASVTQSLLR
ncbi:NAD(P)/FAD-dependent oxidoreductase [Candidatus Poriferisocius sp.]|uniref:NAD(P)/FAD-dependent oxidoreductase n=1 Tax=Candidatus Poriferisocius sp. TaxID=3101276 RepID=UPI003B5BD5A0